MTNNFPVRGEKRPNPPERFSVHSDEPFPVRGDERPGSPVLSIERPADLSRAVIGEVARGSCRIALAPALLDALDESRRATLRDLAGRVVYGVNTGMGALSGVRLDPEAQARHQDTLMTGRAVGSAPWLRVDQARAVVAARLRTLLDPAAGVSPALCQALVALLDAGVTPAIPARGNGAAGEIIPLAHVGAVLNGTGQVLALPGATPPNATPPGVASPGTTDAAEALSAAGLTPRPFGAKEGIAFLEGVPGLTGLAVVASDAARTLIRQIVVGAAASHTVIGASPDPLHPALADSPELRDILDDLRKLRGDAPARALQAPVSFRVTAPALAVAVRAIDALDAATERALTAVTDSPAHLDGEFVGTFGFAGTDLVAAAGALTTALVHLAELGTARLHRLLDPNLTGLNRQLSESPGLHAGMATVHKRAVGITHRLRRFATPVLSGAMETSLGQEDVQSFGFEAAECLDEAITGLREVLACELLAVVQAGRLGATALLPDIDALLPPGTADRPWGRDLDRITEHLLLDNAGR
ncbi:aromatic amino acid lyase [Actinoplanes bogorensis]|uniref:Aromatic amino acid lyase n=1 Tax=Paractinoplanes bogorensis TaxID=1610840 RepID=A0ABS5Z3X0_9ACTN|nr:aromatic amino acid lyase [Actinoplanes bogorensis]MBU2670363.1 aromatic amino acid lyase [Actinoplanes bogorensis]